MAYILNSCFISFTLKRDNFLSHLSILSHLSTISMGWAFHCCSECLLPHRLIIYVHYLHECSMLLNLLSLPHSKFYEVLNCPCNHLFLSECIYLSILLFLSNVNSILGNLTSALIPKVLDSITCTMLTITHIVFSFYL